MTVVKQEVADNTAGRKTKAKHGSKASGSVPGAVWMMGALAVLAVVVYVFLIKPAQQQQHVVERSSSGEARRESLLGDVNLQAMLVDLDSHEDVDIRAHDPLEEDAYCLAVALIVRDLQAIASGNTKELRLRYSRLAFAVGLVLLVITLQVTILHGTKKYVTPQQVADIRDAYNDYEQAMYGDHTYLNKNGKHRGIDPKFFNADAFDDLDGDLQADVCNIPLSQLGFISVVLLVWAITCVAQLKVMFENFMCLIFFADTIDSMADALTEDEGIEGASSVHDSSADDIDEDDGGDSDIDDGLPIQIITGLTLPVKIMLTLFIFLPDCLTTMYLLWLGSRWLVATNDFGNVLSNAVALEFVLALKNLLFYALVTDRNKRDLDHTGLAPAVHKEPASYGIYFSSTVWFFVACLWVWYYINHQQVLLEYKWDVHEVCSTWLGNQLNPDAPQNQ